MSRPGDLGGRHGPLAGIRIVMMGGFGPAPFCGMLLGDLGADVVRVDRVGEVDQPRPIDALLRRSQRSIALDIKHPAGRLVYARMTGWGQDGAYAQMAGHDINYLALSGALGAIGTADTPVPPLNLLGDYGGGGMLLALGLLSGILEARQSGTGQVIDVAMFDAAATLMTVFYGLLADGRWEDRRQANVVDGAAHYYRTYETADGIRQPAPAPRFSRTVAAAPSAPAMPGDDTLGVLAELGMDAAAAQELCDAGATRQSREERSEP